MGGGAIGEEEEYVDGEEEEAAPQGYQEEVGQRQLRPAGPGATDSRVAEVLNELSVWEDGDWQWLVDDRDVVVI
jgi:hypothetical protein